MLTLNWQRESDASFVREISADGRVHRLIPQPNGGEESWTERYVARPEPLKAGQVLRLDFTASAESAETIQLRLSGSQPPWEWLAKSNTLLLRPEPTRFRAWFHITQASDDPCIRFDIGGIHSAVTLQDLTVTLNPEGGHVPARSYMICSTPRSGSSYLSSLLAGVGVLGNPDEYFQHLFYQSLPLPLPEKSRGWTLSPLEYYRRVIASGTSPNSVFAAKMMASHLAPSARFLAELTSRPHHKPFEVLDALFPRVQYLHLYRADRAAQAVSYYLAEISNDWVRFRRPSADTIQGSGDQEAPYDFGAIIDIYDMISQEDELFYKQLRDRDTFIGSLSYEDLQKDPEAALTRVYNALAQDNSLRPGLQEASIKRQSSARKDDFRDRFARDLARARRSGT